MKLSALLAAGLFAAAASPAWAAGPLTDPTIVHNPKDGVVRLFGPGGPHTAYIKAAKAYEARTGTKVEVIFGPESRWTKDAQAGADILFGSSEQSMTAFLENYGFMKSDDVEPLYIRRSVIVVQKGNPKHIGGLADLLKPGMKVIVTEGKGVYNTSGTGVWEDVAGRLDSLADVKALRANIVAYEEGSGASFRAFQDSQADGWITWIHWPLTNANAADYVEIEPERRIYRDTNVVLSADADPAAADFIAFLKSDAGATLFATEGWTR